MKARGEDPPAEAGSPGLGGGGSIWETEGATDESWEPGHVGRVDYIVLDWDGGASGLAAVSGAYGAGGFGGEGAAGHLVEDGECCLEGGVAGAGVFYAG